MEGRTTMPKKNPAEPADYSTHEKVTLSLLTDHRVYLVGEEMSPTTLDAFARLFRATWAHLLPEVPARILDYWKSYIEEIPMFAPIRARSPTVVRRVGRQAGRGGTDLLSRNRDHVQRSQHRHGSSCLRD
jgi:hypothetical protein